MRNRLRELAYIGQGHRSIHQAGNTSGLVLDRHVTYNRVHKTK